MRFLLTGGSGYLGGRLTGHLRKHGHNVVISSRNHRAQKEDFVPWPFTRQQLASAGGIDMIVHMASPDQRSAGADSPAFLKTSVDLAWSVCEPVAGLSPSPGLIYLSTVHVYGASCQGLVTEETLPAPSHPYGLGKRLAEEVVHLFRRRSGFPALCIRLSNAFGAPATPDIAQWHLLFNDLCRQAVTGETLTLNSRSDQRRNFVTLADAARAIEFLALRRADWPSDGVIHVGGGLNLTNVEAAELIATRARTLLGKKAQIRYADSAETQPSRNFEFDTTRLADLSFEWENDADGEIDATLRFCSRQMASPPVSVSV
jgi:UDP-glucose 4-epimerase